jgi:beta-galactosidase/beta-glucuronidase
VGQTFLSTEASGRQECSPHLEFRVIIPEASWWEPKTPFLYEGPVELWQDGVLCDRREISHGIRAK